MGRCILAVAMLATLTLAVRSALAADEIRSPLAADEIHEGKVIAVGEGKITVLDNRDDDNDTFIVTAETKITRNGKPAKLSDVQPGDKAKVIASLRDGALSAKEIAAVAPR
jgi:hypothetical protein